MNTARRAVAATIVCTTVILGAAACGGASKQAGGSGAAPSSAAAEDPLASLSSAEIVEEAIADAKALSTVRLTGSVSNAGQAVTIDLGLVPGKGCTGTMDVAGTGSTQLIAIGPKVWFGPDAAFIAKSSKGNAAVEKLMAGKYLQGSTSSPGLAAIETQVCDLPQIITDTTGDGIQGLPAAVRTTVDGQPALLFTEPDGSSQIVVSDTSTPEILNITATASTTATLDFSQFNAAVALTAPPAAKIITIPTH